MKLIKSFAIAVTAAIILSPQFAFAKSNETILTFDDVKDAQQVLNTAKTSETIDAEMLIDDVDGKTMVLVTSPTDEDAKNLQEAAKQTDGIEAQPNFTYTVPKETVREIDPNDISTMSLPSDFPNDYYLNYEYYLKEVGFSSSQSGSNVKNAWSRYREVENPAKVTVAVLDTGAYPTHEDLQKNVNFSLARDVYNDTNTIRDVVGHGTGVCGIIAAETNNKVGIAGIADADTDNVSVIPIAVFGDEGEGSSSVILKGLKYIDELIESGKAPDIRVINMSLGFYRSNGAGPDDEAIHNMIVHLTNAHSVLSVAAGGNGNDWGEAVTTPMYPSDYDEVIGVTALTKDGANAEFSDYNANKDISAPGVEIAFPVAGNSHGYGVSDGTSYSSPIVSGIATLMISANPSLTPYQVKQIIKTTAAPIPNQSINNWSNLSGSAGAIDAGKALAKAIETKGGAQTEPVVPEPKPEEPAPENPEPVIPEPEPEPDLPPIENPVGKTDMWRLYNPHTGEHLFTTDKNEYDSLGRLGWKQEGKAWTSPTEGIPVYRLYNPNNGDHFYTIDSNEYENLQLAGWRGEDVKFYGATSDGKPIYRLWNEYMTANGGAFSHIWTSNDIECDELILAGWRYENVAWYGMP